MIHRPHRRHPVTSLVTVGPTLYSLLFFIFVNVVSVHAGGSFTHTLPFGTEECLLIRVPTDLPHIISGSFELLDSSRVPSDPVRVAVYNSKEELLWGSNYGDTEGSFSQKGVGKHWLCLENGMTWENDRPHPKQKVQRTIGFAFRVKKSTSGIASEILGKDAMGTDVDVVTDRLLNLSDDLNDNFDVLMDHMSFMKAREIVHRQLHEETFTKVVRWNILEIITVVIVTFGQVLNVWWILSRRSNSYY